MLYFLPASLRGSLSLLLLILNTLFWFSLLFPCALVKLLPIPALQTFLTRVLIRIAENWMLFDSGWMRLAGRTEWDIQGHEGLDHDGWYLVTCNHQSCVDILALQHNLNAHSPQATF